MYQVFISYRRKGGFGTAKHLYDLLTHDGYIVSFDIDTLREGDIDTQLLSRIEECEDFILIVDPNCFDRTLDPQFDPENDWLRQELAHALKHKKNIIPVLLAGASFPDGLPDDIKRVPIKNGPKYNMEYFDSFYAKLKGFLHSVPARSGEGMPVSLNIGARVSFYTKVPCRVEEHGRVLAEVSPGFDGAVIILGKGLHRLLFVSTMDKQDQYTLDYNVKDVDINDVIDIELDKIEASRLSKEREAADKQYAENLYRQGLEYDAAHEDGQAFRCYLEAAEKGCAPAQYILGYYYESGEGETEDLVGAVKWYRMAAEQGYAPAQNKLGYCYEKSEGVTKDLVEAVKWYRLAAEQGYALAQNNLAFCYERGEGVTKDLVEAVKWYRLAAEQGYALAQNILGYYYEIGKVVTKDLTEAAKWYRMAAEQGYAPSQNNLGVCYERGEGVKEDLEEAVKWYRMAAKQGCAVAQGNLGYCYERGEGVKKDLIEAEKLYRLAAEQGCTFAQDKLDYSDNKFIEHIFIVDMKTWRRMAVDGWNEGV